MLEPGARNTAPAIALAAHIALDVDPDAVLAVLPSDHVITNEAAFEQAINTAVEAVAAGGLLTFGIEPSFANTQFGYIERADEAVGDGVSKVAAFHEKPDAATAQKFFDGGRHCWNSGMFVFKAATYLEEIAKFEPEIHRVTKAAITEGSSDLDFFRPSKISLEAPDVSIDYAVMEHTSAALVLPIDIGWSDIGSWSALRELLPQDDAGNATVGDVMTHDTKNSLLFAQSKLIAAVGVEDIIAIETRDAVLISTPGRAKDVGELVKQMRSDSRPEHETHTEVYRPWGSYETVELGERYQVKRIRVKPGASLRQELNQTHE